jgi:hypothetical protein
LFGMSFKADSLSLILDKCTVPATIKSSYARHKISLRLR